MPIAIYRTHHLQIVADGESSFSVKNHEDDHSIFCGMAIIELKPEITDGDYMRLQHKFQQICDELHLDSPTIPNDTQHLMMVWVESGSTAECYAHVVTFNGRENCYFDFHNF